MSHGYIHQNRHYIDFIDLAPPTAHRGAINALDYLIAPPHCTQRGATNGIRPPDSATPSTRPMVGREAGHRWPGIVLVRKSAVVQEPVCEEST